MPTTRICRHARYTNLQECPLHEFAGMPSTGQPRGSVLASGDAGDEEAFRQLSGYYEMGHAVYGCLRADNRSFHLTCRQEAEANRGSSGTQLK